MLIKADRIPQDLNKAEEILSNYQNEENSEIDLLNGLIKKKTKDYEKAFKYFEMASKTGNADAQYEFGKLLYKGLGCKENKKEAMKFFKMSKLNGNNKSDNFYL